MSEHEGFGLPLLSAMCFGLPILAFAQPAVEETIGSTEGLFGNKRLPEVVELLHRLLNQPELRARLIAHQNQRLSAFRPERVAEQLRALIGELLARPC
jgi:glycosyltransferase involved in cell wall biosynthesis